MPVFHSFVQVREDVRKHISDLNETQLWVTPSGAAPVGFHLRHMAGSIDRLLTYLEGHELSSAQFAFLRNELRGEGTFDQLYAELDAALKDAERRLVDLDFRSLDQKRYVGRKRLETTGYGLLVHIAEHTQRHLGQALTTAKFVRSGY
jgi:uncharacterized damage-inducible protein DinB